MRHFIPACKALALLWLVAGANAQESKQEFKIKEVASVAALPISQLAPGTIAFADHKADPLAQPETGLLKFEDWDRTRPLEKELLALWPSYVEPTQIVTVSGVKRQVKRKLHVYVAEARFVVPKPPTALRLADYAATSFIERVDPAIKHRVIAASDVIPNKDQDAAFSRRPDRRWCEPPDRVVCIESRYDLEGKLPTGIRLANKLEEGGKKIAEFLEFQSELKALTPQDIDPASLKKLTGLDTAIAGALEQSTFHVNQIMSFGKLLAVFQAHPTDAGKTVVTAYMVLGIKSDVLEKKKEYANVPVLRNLLPAQVLAGNSSFNTGTSISAGVPKYVRYQVLAIARLMGKG
jgi:hypothetical protein